MGRWVHAHDPKEEKIDYGFISSRGSEKGGGGHVGPKVQLTRGCHQEFDVYASFKGQDLSTSLA
jgi:hypothetical protein